MSLRYEMLRVFNSMCASVIHFFDPPGGHIVVALVKLQDGLLTDTLSSGVSLTLANK